MRIDSKMSDLFCELLKIKKVAVISGGGLKQITKELLEPLSKDANLSNLYLFPTDGAAYYKYESGQWEMFYKELLSDNDKAKIKKAFTEALDEVKFQPTNVDGELIEDRESAMVFSGLGQEAPLELKVKWDPDGMMRHKIKAILDEKIPEFDIHIAGTTSIDVTAKGLNKAYGIRKMVEYIKVPIENMIFIGDSLFPGGNDNPVIKTGIDTMSVENPEETKLIIKNLIC